MIAFHAVSSTQTDFFVVIPTFKNASYCIQNIESLVRQNYSHWKAAIIVDGGPEDDDGTHALLQQYIADHNLSGHITLHKNRKRRYALANIHRAIWKECPSDDAVVVILDGDDYFLHEHVLERIAHEYLDPAVWLTYGQYINIPAATLGICRDFPRDVLAGNKFRQYPFIASHPRTFKAWLFKQIKLEDLCYKGRFFSVTYDVAIMLPMLEMASPNHIRFISKPLYAYRHYENNDYAVRYKKLAHRESVIRSRQRYQPLLQRPASS